MKGLIFLLLLSGALPVHGEGEPNAAWFNSLTDREGYSCCRGEDCSTTEAWLQGGHWKAIFKERVVDVPDEKVIRPVRPNPTGEAVLCIGFSGVVHCFVPPDEA